MTGIEAGSPFDSRYSLTVGTPNANKKARCLHIKWMLTHSRGMTHRRFLVNSKRARVMLGISGIRSLMSFQIRAWISVVLDLSSVE